MEIMTKALRGLLNRAKFAVEQKRITITVDAATIASIAHELLEFRDVFTEGRPAIDRAHMYVQKHSVDFNFDTNDVVDTVLDDAERLRAVVAQQTTEIEALRAEVESRQRMYETEGEMRRQSERLVEKLAWFNNALDAKPDAAPAPVEIAAAREIAVGDRVRVKETEERGKLFMEFESPYLGKQYRVEFTNGEYADYDRDEIEPA